jgi:hypothetical protein
MGERGGGPACAAPALRCDRPASGGGARLGAAGAGPRRCPPWPGRGAAASGRYPCLTWWPSAAGPAKAGSGGGEQTVSRCVAVADAAGARAAGQPGAGRVARVPPAPSQSAEQPPRRSRNGPHGARTGPARARPHPRAPPPAPPRGPTSIMRACASACASPPFLWCSSSAMFMTRMRHHWMNSALSVCCPRAANILGRRRGLGAGVPRQTQAGGGLARARPATGPSPGASMPPRRSRAGHAPGQQLCGRHADGALRGPWGQRRVWGDTRRARCRRGKRSSPPCAWP